MILFSVILILIFLHYSYLLNKIALKIAIDPSFKHDSKTLHKISIIIPFRNETQNLKSVILSLLELDYNLDSFEILFINDHSEDDYKSVFDEFPSVNNIHLIDSNGEGKKAAIETGIRNARFNWILSSDADCNFDSTWLFSCIHTINTQHSDLFILPVYTAYGKSVLAKFQHYDSLSILGVNVGYYSWKNIVLLASGANLLYKKNKFEEANPFVNNKNIHSGDDMFILQEFKLKINKNLNCITPVRYRSRASRKF